MPEKYMVNIGKESAVPKCYMPGHNWGEIVHR